MFDPKNNDLYFLSFLICSTLSNIRAMTYKKRPYIYRKIMTSFGGIYL